MPYLSSSTDNVLFDIDLSNPGKHNGRKGAYVTPTRLNQNYYAKYKLSLTYVPNYINELDQNSLKQLINYKRVSIINNKQNDITQEILNGRDGFERVWPSFGSYGGAEEAFLCFDQNNQITFSKTDVFSFPGGLDFYHSDDDENIGLDLANLITGITELYPSGDNYPERENGQAKRIGNNVSINVTYNRNWNVTASIAYNNSTPSAYLKCWLNAWTDFPNSAVRKIYFSESAEYVFNKTDLYKLRQQRDLTKNLFFPLFEELKYHIPTINANLSPIYAVKLV